MARPVIDISLLGDKKLERALAKLPPLSQVRAVKPAIRKSAKRMRPKVAAATPVNTGRLKQEMETAPIRGTTKKGLIRIGMVQPLEAREAIKLNVLEYGSAQRGLAPTRFVRNTVDKNASAEHRQMGKDIGHEIVKQWGKLNRR